VNGRHAAALLAAGAILLGGAAALARASSPPSPRGTAVAVQEVGTVPDAAPSPAPTRQDSRVPQAAVPPPRTRLRIAAAAVVAPVVPVRARGGVMDVPRDPHTVGWWSGGARPGASSGHVVVVGHVNYSGVAGALSAIPRLRLGDVVDVVEPTVTLKYRVSARRVYAKDEGLPSAIFATDGPAQLVLVTCGGDFDPTSGNYRDNVVVFADPVSGGAI
jgi:hypothetical protein